MYFLSHMSSKKEKQWNIWRPIKGVYYDIHASISLMKARDLESVSDSEVLRPGMEMRFRVKPQSPKA